MSGGCTGLTPFINGAPGSGAGGGDPTVFSGEFSTNGAEIVDVPLVNLAAFGAWAMIWSLSIGGTTQDNGIGIAAYGGIIWGMGEATMLRNDVDPPQFYGSQFGAPFQRNQGYTQPGLYAAAGIPANIVFVGNVGTLRVNDASGFIWDWAYRGSLSVYRGAVRLV